MTSKDRSILVAKSSEFWVLLLFTLFIEKKVRLNKMKINIKNGGIQNSRELAAMKHTYNFIEYTNLV